MNFLKNQNLAHTDSKKRNRAVLDSENIFKQNQPSFKNFIIP